MTMIFLGEDAYSRSHGILPEVKCINQFVEAAPSAETGMVLLPRPALKAWATAGVGPCRGIFREAGVIGGDFAAVSGTTAYRVTSAGAVTSLGAVSGLARVEMAGSGSYLVIATGGAGYSYDGATFATISFPDGVGISTVDYIDGYFIFGRAGSQRFYWTPVGAITVDPLDYASAERTPDNLVCVRVISDRIWLLGESSIEVWVTTGQSDLPFQRINGFVLECGCVGRDTVVKLGETLFWVGKDHIVYRNSAAGPDPVSTNSISERIRRADKTKLRAWAFTWDGHPFYALTIDTAGTFCFDTLTGAWCEFASYGRAAWRAHVGAYTPDLVIAGDNETGQLWQLTDDVLLDGADPIVIEATGLLPISARRVPNTNFALDMAKGTAAVGENNTYVEMRYSDDAGQTWTGWKQRSLGATGEYHTRITFNRLSNMSPPGRVFHTRMSSPLPYRLTKASVNERHP